MTWCPKCGAAHLSTRVHRCKRVIARCAGGVIIDGKKSCPVCGAGTGDQCAKASLRDFEEMQKLRDFVEWINCWVSNSAESYSTSALEGLFKAAREKISALSPADRGTP